MEIKTNIQPIFPGSTTVFFCIVRMLYMPTYGSGTVEELQRIVFKPSVRLTEVWKNTTDAEEGSRNLKRQIVLVGIWEFQYTISSHC